MDRGEGEEGNPRGQSKRETLEKAGSRVKQNVEAAKVKDVNVH